MKFGKARVSAQRCIAITAALSSMAILCVSCGEPADGEVSNIDVAPEMHTTAVYDDIHEDGIQPAVNPCYDMCYSIYLLEIEWCKKTYSKPLPRQICYIAANERLAQCMKNCD